MTGLVIQSKYLLNSSYFLLTSQLAKGISQRKDVICELKSTRINQDSYGVKIGGSLTLAITLHSDNLPRPVLNNAIAFGT